jgi:DNA-binding transcriptional MocR family regulator
MPLQRKQEVYAVACEHDLLILEDDPYYILQFRNGALSPFLADG